MRPVTINPFNVPDALNELMGASHENDIVEIAKSFSVDSSLVSTATSLPALPASIQTFVVGNDANTTEKTLGTYTLPANSLTAINQGIKISAAGYWGSGAHDAKIRLYFGTSVLTLDNTSTDGTRWYAEMTVLVAAVGPTQVFITGIGQASFAVAPMGDDPSIALASPVTIKVTGQSPVSGVANEANAYQLLVEPLGGSGLAAFADAFAAFLLICQKGGANRTT